METDPRVKALTDELAKHETDPQDWVEDYDLHRMNEAMDECGMKISLDIHGTPGCETIGACYYSGKIHRSIILDWDVYATFGTLEELAEYLVDLEETATEIEEAITFKS